MRAGCFSPWPGQPVMSPLHGSSWLDHPEQKGFLTIAGSGYRRERKGSPLANIWRQVRARLLPRRPAAACKRCGMPCATAKSLPSLAFCRHAAIQTLLRTAGCHPAATPIPPTMTASGATPRGGPRCC